MSTQVRADMHARFVRVPTPQKRLFDQRLLVRRGCCVVWSHVFGFYLMRVLLEASTARILEFNRVGGCECAIRACALVCVGVWVGARARAWRVRI